MLIWLFTFDCIRNAHHNWHLKVDFCLLPSLLALSLSLVHFLIMYPVFWSIFMLRRFFDIIDFFPFILRCRRCHMCVCVCCQNELRTEIRNMDGIFFSFRFSFFLPFNLFLLCFFVLVAGKYILHIYT